MTYRDKTRPFLLDINEIHLRKLDECAAKQEESNTKRRIMTDSACLSLLSGAAGGFYYNLAKLFEMQVDVG